MRGMVFRLSSALERYPLNTSSNMRAICLTVLSASLLIHAALGCCHHAQGIADNNESVWSQAVDSSCCNHDQDAAPVDPQHNPCDGHSNCHGMCHYLPAQKSKIDCCSGGSAFDVAICNVPIVYPAVAAVESLRSCREYGVSRALRLHLLHQIMLI